jgi:RHS repeat-associated protein
VKLEYWHKDHLGSLMATSDHLGLATARYSYDPFGKRRMTSGSYDANGTLIVDWTTDTNKGTDRGYTGHEHLDDVGLIHMNGRIFDPTLGHFLQTDPFIQDPTNLQNFNRYGYCFNNPMTCSDPSGASFLSGLFRPVTKAWHSIWRNPVARIVIVVAVSYYAGKWALDAYANSVAAESGFAAGSTAYEKVVEVATSSVRGGIIAGSAGGFAGSFVASNGNFKAGMRGAVAGGVTGGTQAALHGSAWYARAAGMGMAGGTGAVIFGGNFSNGFKYAAGASLLKSAMDAYARGGLAPKYSEYESSLRVATKDAVAKIGFENINEFNQEDVTEVCGRNCAVPDIEAATTGRAVLTKYLDDVMNGVKAPSGGFFSLSESGGFLSGTAKWIPGFQAFSIFHDVLMSDLEATMRGGNIFGAINLLSIPPAAIMQYQALGVRQIIYQNELEKNNEQ